MPNPFQPGELPERQSLRDRNVLIMGLGSFGGGLGAARFCVQQGANVTVTDLRTDTDLRPSLSRLQGLKINYRLGTHEGINFAGYDMIVVNPAVNPASPLLQQARGAGVYLTSEMNLFIARCPGKVVGITGSNGKTTTTALTAHLLKGSDRKVWIGGNIGLSLLERVAEIGEKDAVVLELSSFQLDDMHRIRISPTVGVLLNLTPNHLDRHGSMEGYAAAKMGIFAWQTSKDIALLNFDDIRVARLQSEVKSRLAMFSVSRKVQPGGYIMRSDFMVDLGGGAKSVCPVKDLQLPGKHNRSNALAAIIAAMAMRTPASKIGGLLRTFKGVEHRCEYVGERDSVKFYNDSVSTTPESTIASMSAFKQADTWLILGGADKALEYDNLAEAIATQQRVAGVVCIGEIGPGIANVVRDACDSRGRQLSVIDAPSLPDALDELRRNVRPNQVVLLSPATASYDQYRNFEERGAHFKELVVRWQRAAGTVAPRGRRLTADSVKVSKGAAAPRARSRWQQVTPAAPPMFPGSQPGVPQAPQHSAQAPNAARPQPQRPAARRTGGAPAGPGAPAAGPGAPARQAPMNLPAPSMHQQQMAGVPASPAEWPGSSPGGVAPAHSDALIDPWAPDNTGSGDNYSEDWSADPWARGQTNAGLDQVFPEQMGDTWTDLQAVEGASAGGGGGGAIPPMPGSPAWLQQQQQQSPQGLPVEASATWTESNPLPQNFGNPFVAALAQSTPSDAVFGGGGESDTVVDGDFGPTSFDDPFAGVAAMPAESASAWSDTAANAGAWADGDAADSTGWAEPATAEAWEDTQPGLAPGGMATAEQIFGGDSDSNLALPSFGHSPLTPGAPIDPNAFATHPGGPSVFGDETSAGTMPDMPLSLFNFGSPDATGGATGTSTQADGALPALFRDTPALVNPMDTGTLPRFQVPGMKGYTGPPPDDDDIDSSDE
ncbi:MAG: UDP-N-acetylmuramoyl-L-alanine--D-glutamate ligase [Planctomycetota bacterium]